MIQQNADILLEASNDHAIRVKLLFVLYPLPIGKRMLSSVIVMPVIRQRNDESDMMNARGFYRIINVLQRYLVEDTGARFNAQATPDRDTQRMTPHDRLAHK